MVSAAAASTFWKSRLRSSAAAPAIEPELRTHRSATYGELNQGINSRDYLRNSQQDLRYHRALVGHLLKSEQPA